MVGDGEQLSDRHPVLFAAGTGCLIAGALLALLFMTIAWLLIGGLAWLLTAVAAVVVDIAKGRGSDRR